VLRSTPALGAMAIAPVLASRPVRRKAGTAMFTGVAIFGVATVVFGLSRSFWLSLVALAVLGGVLSLLVTASWARLFPALRHVDRLE
jgi:energy-converting hydrogenase Eha subunit A